MVDEKLKKYKADLSNFMAYRLQTKRNRNEDFIKLVYYLIKKYGITTEYDTDLYRKISNSDEYNNRSDSTYWFSTSDVAGVLNSDCYNCISEEQQLNRQKIMEA